jgi:hypothetical protein
LKVNPPVVPAQEVVPEIDLTGMQVEMAESVATPSVPDMCPAASVVTGPSRYRVLVREIADLPIKLVVPFNAAGTKGGGGVVGVGLLPPPQDVSNTAKRQHNNQTHFFILLLSERAQE